MPPPIPVMALPYATPAAYQAPEQGWMWEWDQLVVPLKVELPSRCVKCGRPGATRHLVTIYWMNPLYLLLILVNWLVLLVVYLCVRKTGVVGLWLCREHERKRQRVFRIAWGLMGLAGVAFVGSIVWFSQLKRRDEWMSAFGFLGSVVILLVGACVAIFCTRIVRASKIDAQRMWLKGVSPEALR